MVRVLRFHNCMNGEFVLLVVFLAMSLPPIISD